MYPTSVNDLKKSSVSFDVFREDLNRLNHPRVRSVGEAFAENLDAAGSLLMMPHIVEMQCSGWIRLLYKASTMLVHAADYESVQQGWKAVLYKAFVSSEENKTALVDAMFAPASKALNDNPSLYPSAYRLLGSSISLIWGSLEILSKDLLSISLDLNRNLTPAKEYRFGNPAGISRTFKTASPTLFQAFTDELDKPFSQLVLLAQYRHLIQHQCGVIDQDFLNKTGLSLSIGDKLPLEVNFVVDSVDAVLTAGRVLLTVVDTL